jgi:hypothetical protein
VQRPTSHAGAAMSGIVRNLDDVDCHDGRLSDVCWPVSFRH